MPQPSTTTFYDRINIAIFNTADFVVFGLILHISNINELEHFDNCQRSWKTIQNGTSVTFILWYGILFAAYLLGQSSPGLIDANITRYVAMGFSLISLLISFSIYNRVSTLLKIA